MDRADHPTDADIDFVLVALTDDSGRLLLQERDEHAHVFPDSWGLPGGSRETGESVLVCGLRELQEETAIDDVDLVELGRYDLQLPGGDPWRFAVLHGATRDRTPECHEGRQMVFTPTDQIVALDLGDPLAHALPDILAEPSRVARHGPAPWLQVRYANVLLVDERGWFLLQERDEHPVLDPETWALPGGHVEDGESFEAAAYRELTEETGIELPPGTLAQMADFALDHRPFGRGWDRMQVFTAQVDLVDADVECHEGRQMVFVDPAVVPGLPLALSLTKILPGFPHRPDCASMEA